MTKLLESALAVVTREQQMRERVGGRAAAMFSDNELNAIERLLVEAIAKSSTPARPVPPDLVALSAKSNSGEWFVEHGATDSGLSRIDDGTMHGMFPIHGEAHEIELAAAAVNRLRAEIAAQAERGEDGR